MVGYNMQDALGFIQSKLNAKAYASLNPDFSQLILQAIEGDLAYMYQSGVIDEEGLGGEVYYDEDDAFEYILEHLIKVNHFDGEKALLAASFLIEFTQQQYAYMEKAGLVAQG